MARSVMLALLLGLSGVFGLEGCSAGPGREDAAIVRLQTLACDKAYECGCDDIGFGCDDWQEQEPNNGSAPQRAFDASCLPYWEAWVEELRCEAPTVPGYAKLCPLYHGTIYEGMPCETVVLEFADLSSTDCARGLYCVAGICRDARTIELGAEGQPCDVGERCGAGLRCGEEVCERLPTRGELCPDHVCAGEDICEIRCRPLPSAGQECDLGRCDRTAYCVFDNLGGSECIAAGAIAEPCAGHRQCISGNCPAGFCRAATLEGGVCGGQLPCGEGLTCIQQACQRIDDDEIPVGSACGLLSVL